MWVLLAVLIFNLSLSSEYLKCEYADVMSRNSAQIDFMNRTLLKNNIPSY